MEPFDAILCGAGRMGRNHLRVVANHPSFRLVAIVDPALAHGTLDGVPVVSELSEVEAPYRVAIVATPAHTHEALAVALVDRGVDLLIEKPLACTVAGCEQIRAHARTSRVAVGHIERFNPAVRAMTEALPAIGAIHRLTFVRVGRGRARERGDVLHELAVHDLDLLERIAGRATLRSARVRSLHGDDLVDVADLELVTETGAVASIHVDSISEERARTLRLEGERGAIEVDLLSPASSLISDGIRRPLPIDPVEPLTAQLRAFHALLIGAPSDISLLSEAARAVELAADARTAGLRRTLLASPPGGPW